LEPNQKKSLALAAKAICVQNPGNSSILSIKWLAMCQPNR
jgi:hypothetical protein